MLRILLNELYNNHIHYKKSEIRQQHITSIFRLPKHREQFCVPKLRKLNPRFRTAQRI